MKAVNNTDDAATKKTEPKTGKLDALVKDLQKKYGTESLSIFGEAQAVVEWIPVDSFSITELLGNGIPRGRIIEVFGLESSGKTTFLTYLAAQIQKHYFEDRKRYGVVAFIDAEHAYDPEYAKSFGLDMRKVLFSQPDSGEQALNIVQDLAESEEVDCILVDSVAALTPQSEIDGEMGDMQVGLQARLMSKMCRKLTAKTKPNSATIIFSNQMRAKIGGWSPAGEALETPGGKALKFYSSIRIQTKKGDWIGEANDVEGLKGIHCILKTQKNKLASPFRTVDMSIIFGQGYQLENEYIAAWVKYGLVKKSKGWFTITNLDGSESKAQGTNGVMDYMKEHPDLYDDLKNRLKTVMTSKKTVITEKQENEDEVVAEQERLESEFNAQDAKSLAEQAAMTTETIELEEDDIPEA